MIAIAALFIVGVPAFILGACFNQLLTESRLRHSIRRRAYRTASDSALMQGYSDRLRHGWALAVATQFYDRAALCGIGEALRELDAWERDCKRTNEILRQGVVEVSKQDEAEAAEVVAAIEARLGGGGSNVVSLKRPRP